MALLNDFQKEDVETIISLPYRVGVWIAHADDVQSTKRDEKREEKALKAVLNSLESNKRKWPFLAEVVDETLDNKRLWPKWAARQDLHGDIARACAVIAEHQPAETVVQFKKALFHIACTVAQAAGDDDDLHSEALIGEIAAKLADKFFDPLAKNPENISAAEKAALQKLKDALKG
jgi:hypothetical protein